MPDRDWSGFQRRRITAPPPPLPDPDERQAEADPTADQDTAAAPTPDPGPAPAPAARAAPGRGRPRSPRAARRAHQPTQPPPAPDGEPTLGRREPAAVWLPSALREQVRAEAEGRRMSQTALFVTAFNATHDRLRAAKPAAAEGTALLQRPPARRRYRVAGGTQLGLYLTETELRIVDEFAAELGVSRSELATEVFETYLQSDGRGGARR